MAMRSLAFFLFLFATSKLYPAPNLLIKIYGSEESCNETISRVTHSLKDQSSCRILMVIENENSNRTFGLNMGVDSYSDWFDILLVLEGGAMPLCHHFDEKIGRAMDEHFPDFDGVLNFQKNVKGAINHFPIMGKKYYQRFGCIYHPKYNKSCYKEELTFVSRILGKEKLIERPLFIIAPQTYQSQTDTELFQSRRNKDFGLDLSNFYEKDWSILICTLEERKEQFESIYQKVLKQIQRLGLEDKIEVLFHRDNREISIGEKRNQLVKRARGKYINFIDDDDDVHEEYIQLLYERLKVEPDCVNLYGIITFNGSHSTPFIHSIMYSHYFDDGGTYYRPPNHLNPIKRSIGAQFLFPTISWGEDTDWAMQVAHSKLLQTEERVDAPYYFYNYIPDK